MPPPAAAAVGPLTFAMPSTTRLRRRSKASRNSRNPILRTGERGQSVAACAIEQTEVQDWLCISRHRLDQRRRTDGIADAPAGHRIGLGYAVDDQVRAFSSGRPSRTRRSAAVEQDVLVDLVRQDQDLWMPARAPCRAPEVSASNRPRRRDCPAC
jgi:hypothetical protein